MSQAFDVETTIARPVPEVWQRLTDWHLAPRWMAGVESLRADGPTEQGTTLTFTARGKTRTSEISAIEPQRSLTLTSVQGGVTAHYRYRLDPSGDHTRARLTAEVEIGGAWRLLAPLLRRVIRHTDHRQLDALRNVIEETDRERST